MAVLIGQFGLLQPAWLTALVLLPLIAFLAWRTTTMMRTWQRHLSTALRAVIFVLLLLGLARPVNQGLSPEQFVVFVRDVSDSVRGPTESAQQFIDQAVAQKGDHEVRCLPFADRPGNPSHGANVDLGKLDLDPRASHPEAALLLAAGLLPPDTVGKIVLLTDGRETAGQLFAAAQGMRVPIHVVPLPHFEAPEVGVARIALPQSARPLAPFAIEVVAFSNRQTDAVVVLEQNSEEVERREVQLEPGENPIRFRSRVPRGSGANFSATVTAVDDLWPDNNRRQAVVMVEEPPRALLVANSTAFATTLRDGLTQAGFDTATVPNPSRIPWRDASFSDLDAMVMVDVPPSSIPAAAAAALQGFVRGGGGLIVVGGKTTFAEEEFGGSPLEPIMPIKALKRREERRPVLALVLVIDKSLSMEKENRMTLAKEAAKKTVGVLHNDDKVGVIAFGDDSAWISDLARLANRGEVQRRIDGLSPKGTTKMYPALEKAYLALKQEDADRRAMIVLTDGVPTPGDYDVLAQAMGDARIRVSTVTVSEGADQTIMQDIARLSGGQHYHCDDPNEVPRILEREARRASAPVAAAEFRPFTLRKLPGLDVSSAPPLTGYAATSPKPQSEVLLVTAEGDPLLSWWRYGRGIVVAGTSPGVAGQAWGRWDGYDSFWGQLARHAVRRQVGSDIDVYVGDSEVGMEIVVDVPRELDEAFGRATADVRLTWGQDRLEEFSLAQVAPGLYRSTGDRSLFPSRAPDESTSSDGKRDLSPLLPTTPCEFQITVAADGRTLHETRRGWWPGYSRELRVHPDGVDEPLLKAVARATGGTYDPKPAEIFSDDGRRADRVSEWWSYLLMAALVLFVFDVALRRMRFSGGES